MDFAHLNQQPGSPHSERSWHMAPELQNAYPSRVLNNKNLEQLGEQLDGIIEMDRVNTERVDIPI